MFLKLIISLPLLIFTTLKSEAYSVKWIDDFMKNIKNDNIYEVIFLIDDTSVTSDSICKNLMQQLSSNFPVRGIIVQNDTTINFVSYHPQKSLFVLINSKNDSEFARPIDLLNKHLESFPRPKCLIVLSRQLENYTTFFEKLWSQQFLDVTIVEMKQPKTENPILLGRQRKIKEAVTIVQYNPFSKLLHHETATFRTAWFPTKLRNLHKYPLVASFIQAPPDVVVSQKKSGKVSISGLTVTKLRAFEKSMNFTLLKSSHTKWGKFTCTLKESFGPAVALLKNEIQIMAIELSNDFGCSKKKQESNKGFRVFEYGLVVPNIQQDFKFVMFHQQWTSISTMIGLLFFIWIVSRIFGFPVDNWRIEFLVRMMFGTPVPKEPTNRAERIVFATFLIVCFLFSSEIYTMITNVQLKTGTKFQYESVEDVIASNLEVMMNRGHLEQMKNPDSVLKQLLRKTVPVYFNHETCLKRLLQHKNTTCIGSVDRTNALLRNARDKCGQPFVKIIKDHFPSFPGAMPLAPGSPYGKRFDTLTQRLIDTGIANKWMEQYIIKKDVHISKSCTSKRGEAVLMLGQMFCIPTLGFTCSCLIFICEILYNHVQKKRN